MLLNLSGKVHVTISWSDAVGYRVSRIHPDGTEGMFVFYHSIKEALKHAEYFYSFGDVE